MESTEVGLITDALASGGTRARILKESSLLFGRNGYEGTSTRMIAAAVDIQQPSLFHHFGSKAEIMNELLRLSLEEPAEYVRGLLVDPRPATERLEEFLKFDIHHVLGSPYDLIGPRRIVASTHRFSPDDLGNTVAGTEWGSAHIALRDARRDMIADGVKAGEFIEVDVEMAADAMVGLIIGAMLGRVRYEMDPDLAADAITAFVMRALLP